MTLFEVRGYLEVYDETLFSDDDSKAWFKALLKNGGEGLYLHSNVVGDAVGSFKSIELVYEMVSVE